jgi:hypothetical protein
VDGKERVGSVMRISHMRHPELVSGSIGINGAELSDACSWMLNQVQHDGRVTQSISCPAVISQMSGLQK